MHAHSSPDGTIQAPDTISISFDAGVVGQEAMSARAAADFLGRPGGTSTIRAVPLLHVSGAQGQRVVMVGHSRVIVQDVDHVAVECFLSNIWTEGADEGEFTLVDKGDAGGNTRVKEAVLRFKDVLPAWPEASEASDPQMHAARHAKALAEMSRNSVAQVREIRYALEHRLAVFSGKGHQTASNTPIVASLLELNIICGRAADQAREAVREGLWLHLSDSVAYHSYRRLQDPSIINDAAVATPSTRTWMRLHDAAIRQCLEMRKQLDAESATTRALMAAAASISNSREADAQSSFNTLAAVASLGLGIPALVLALYGADRLLPLNTESKQLAFIPVAAGLFFAALIAIWRAPKGKSSRVWIFAAIGIILILLSLLITAGLLAPSN